MISFDNTEIAFAGRTNRDLKQARLLFKLISDNRLVNIGSRLTMIALKLHLPITSLIKATIYHQFCGGETIRDCNDTIQYLANHHIKTILDYSVEGQESEVNFDNAMNNTVATVNRAQVDDNIPYSVFKMTAIARFALLEKVSKGEKLSEEETGEFEEVKKRVRNICNIGYELDTAIFIDAEESWIQDAIDSIALEMMQKYNRKKPMIYNTYQLYRKDRLEYLKKDFEAAEKGGYFLGAKLVRGAYMEKERDRADKMGYPSPIQDTKEDTDRDYNLALEFCIKNFHRIALCAGTHNEESSLLLTRLMAENGIEKSNQFVYFSQLYGMSDHISFNLAFAGYNVAKYVPYGPVRDVLPYLIRRAQENTSIAGQTGRELNLILNELERRKEEEKNKVTL